jgi:outer membrane protein
MRKSFYAVLMTLVTLPLLAQTSAPSRVAVIDVRKVLAESAAGKAAFERLKKMQDEKASRAQKLNEELASLESQMKTKSMSLSEEKVAELNRQFTDRKVALQRFAQDADRELTEARDRALQDLEKLIMPVINDLGKEMGFAIIFNKFEAGLVYASDAIDVTDVVVKRFNDATAKPTPAAAAKQ